MGDIFDQVAAKKPAAGDIFDQVAVQQPGVPPPNTGLAPAAGAPPKTLDSGEGPIAQGLTSFENRLANVPPALGSLIKSSWMDKPSPDRPTVSDQLLNPKNLNPVITSEGSLPRNIGATAANLAPLLIDMGGGGITESPAFSGVQALKKAALGEPTPAANLVNGVYSKPGSRIAASLRGSSRFDVPAAASDAHAAISEGLADRGITATDFKGRNGPAALQAGIDNALDIHEARAKQIIDPIRDQEIDPATLNANPELKARFSPEQLKKGLTYGDIDTERIQLNKDLRRANFYSKDPSAQYAVADPLANAHAAADQARSLVYGKAEQTTGTNLRPLKQTESNLIKLGDLAETTKNGLSAGAAQNETASPLAKGVNVAKKIIFIKKNPASSLASLANSPETLDLNGFNANMRKAFANVKAAPGSVLKNGRLMEPGPGVLTPSKGVTPPELSRQLPLSLESNKPGYELTPPAGKTPPELQPRQTEIPLEHGYHDIPGQDLLLTPPPPGEVGPTPLQNLLDFSREAHPEDVPVLLKKILQK